MLGYQLHDKDEDIVGAVYVPEDQKDNVFDDWHDFIHVCNNDEYPNVREFADMYGYEVLYLESVKC